MPLDPSFRSRLREAIQQSLKRRPSTSSEAPGSTAAQPDAPGNRDAAAETEPALDTVHYEPEDEGRTRDEEQAAWMADLLGGWWSRDGTGVCLVIDREYAADRLHGDVEVGRYAETLARYQETLRQFRARQPRDETPTLFTEIENDEAGAGGAGEALPLQQGAQQAPPLHRSDEERFLFFDLETTGLSGGAGTCAFLIGYGWFERESFRTRQYFLSGFGHEAAMLRMAAQQLQPLTAVPVLATFNGKTFDVPLIEGRYLFHRVPSPFEGIAHIDLLHPARHLWRHRPSQQRQLTHERRDAFARYFHMTRIAASDAAMRGAPRRRVDLSASAASCALGALEEAVLGFRRLDDVPGADIPTRYFHYVRTGDARSLEPVLEHNRLDLLSLAAVASVVARMLDEGPEAARNAHECLALGRLYERSGAAERATACYELAVDGKGGVPWREDGVVQREALRRLALRHRRDRRYDEAAAAWQRLLDLASAEAAMDFEALHALAVHHEHRTRDLAAARALVVRALDGADGRLERALRHRLARIDRKLTRPGR